MIIRWITPSLGTASALIISQEKELNINIIDVRDLVDKEGNRLNAIHQKIVEGYESLCKNKKTVVCCDYGISRSNAIAVGILAMYESISFEEAVRRVLKATGEKEIKVEPLQAVRSALGVNHKWTPHKKFRLLVTGGNGTIGRVICQKLCKTYELFAPNRNDLDLLLGGTQLDLIVGEKQIDRIIHLANPRIYSSNSALGDTLTMLRNVLDVCVIRDVKLIYLSTWEVYSGYRTSNLKADESLPLLPKGPYSESKYLCEILIEHWRKMKDLHCIMLRSSPVYGVGSDKPKFIYTFIDKIKRSQRIVTHCYKNGLPSLDLLYIDDLVSAILKTIKSDFSGNLNIGTGVVTSTRKVAEILRELLSGKNEIDSGMIDSDTACIALDSNKAYRVLGWKSTTKIETGLQRILSNLQRK